MNPEDEPLSSVCKDPIVSEELSDDGSHGHIICTKNHRMIFVGGHNDPEESCVYHASTLSYQLRELCNNPLRAIHPIVNTSSLFRDTPADLIKQVQDFAVNLQPCKDKKGISLVVFAHSLGSKVVYQALGMKALEKVVWEKLSQMDGKLDDKTVQNRVKEIRNHTAIYTFGGVQMIPKHFSELTGNFLFNDDRTAQFASRVLKEEDVKDAIIHHVDITTSQAFPQSSQRDEHGETQRNSERKEEPHAQGLGERMKSFFGGMVTRSVEKMPQMPKSTNHHFMNYYSGNNEMTRRIIRELGLDKENECSCFSNDQSSSL